MEHNNLKLRTDSMNNYNKELDRTISRMKGIDWHPPEIPRDFIDCLLILLFWKYVSDAHPMIVPEGSSFYDIFTEDSDEVYDQKEKQDIINIIDEPLYYLNEPIYNQRFRKISSYSESFEKRCNNRIIKEFIKILKSQNLGEVSINAFKEAYIYLFEEACIYLFKGKYMHLNEQSKKERLKIDLEEDEIYKLMEQIQSKKFDDIFFENHRL